MSETTIADIVEAPAEIVWRQIVAMVEAPQHFLEGMRTLESEKLEGGDLLRRMDVAGWMRTERIAIDEAARSLTCTLCEDRFAEGTVSIRVFEHGGAAPALTFVEYVGAWRPLSRKRGPQAVEVLAEECRALAAAVKRAAESSPRR